MRMRPSLGGKFAMFGVRHGPGHGHLSRLQDLIEMLVVNHGEQVEVWLQPPVLLLDEELVGDEPHDAADLVLRPRAQPRMAALHALYGLYTSSSSALLFLHAAPPCAAHSLVTGRSVQRVVQWSWTKN